jgi:transposase
MIPEELRSRIRRLFFAEHWRVGTISAELGVHHQTVAHAIEAERFLNVRFRASSVDPYKSFIVATLKDHPRLRATRIHAMVRDRGYLGSVTPVRRFVRAVRPESRREAFLRLAVLPGEQAQVDWGSFGSIIVGRARRSLSCFVMVLSWSRGIFARFTLDQTLESFVRCHVLAFQAFDGVPRAILYDNLKSVVLERHGDLVRFHPRLLELAGHYHFAPRPCAPARGNEKGRVERAIQYLRHSFFAARRFISVDDLNQQLDAWIERIAHARFVPADPDRRVVRDALAEEHDRLLRLPAHPFESDLVRPVASGKTPYIRFDLNDYSIPFTLVRKPLTLVASPTSVRILDGSVEVARHDRCYDRGRQIEIEAHIAALTTHKRRARELRGRDRLRSACPHAESFLAVIAEHGGHLGGTTSRLLRLLDRNGAARLDAAIALAHARGAFAAHSVAHIIDQELRAAGKPPPVDLVPSSDPRARDLRRRRARGALPQ